MYVCVFRTLPNIASCIVVSVREKLPLALVASPACISQYRKSRSQFPGGLIEGVGSIISASTLIENTSKYF